MKARHSVPLTWQWEDRLSAQGCSCIAGVDEAGRGCLAGPVVAGAVVFLDRAALPDELNDSKKLTRAQRARMFGEMTQDSRLIWASGSASVEEIDEINILRASHLAMRRAVDALAQKPGHLIVDGLRVDVLGEAQTPLVGGDGISPSVAAASIIAKETRDRLMEELETGYPGYGFGKHKGYGTKQHLEALSSLGPCVIHRRSFGPVRQSTLGF